jgi:WD40 repeat protein
MGKDMMGFAEPTHGYYELVLPNGRIDRFEIPSYGMCYYPQYYHSRWGKIYDDKQLVLVGIACEKPSDWPHVIVYDLSERRVISDTAVTYKACTDPAISHDKKTFALSCMDGIHLYDLASGAQREILKTFRIRQVEFSPDDEIIAALVGITESQLSFFPHQDRFVLTDTQNVRAIDLRSPDYIKLSAIVLISTKTSSIVDVIPAEDASSYEFDEESYRQGGAQSFTESRRTHFCFKSDNSINTFSLAKTNGEKYAPRPIASDCRDAKGRVGFFIDGKALYYYATGSRQYVRIR